MRNAHSIAIFATLFISACSSSDGTAGSGKKPESSSGPSAKTSSETGAFILPPLAEGYTRVEARTVQDIEPGDDVTHCQYVMAPVNRDMDVMDITGAQSNLGHHAVAFSYTPPKGQEVGSELKCMTGSTEFTAGDLGPDGVSDPTLSGGTFLGGAGPTPGRVAALPEGVAFRLKKGEGIMLNLHYINTSLEPGEGDAYLDLKLVDVDPNRLIAALFVNVNGGFSLAPNAPTDSTADCVAQSGVNIIMMGNHMHEWGTHASTQVVRKDTGAVEMLHDDPAWTNEMVTNSPMTRWTADSPFVLRPGDTIRTNCSWSNDTPETVTFPREMCMSVGFALASGNAPKAPTCFNGAWFEQGI